MREKQQYDPIDLARMAAFLDGEGSISVESNSRKRTSPGFALSVSIGNTDSRLPQWCLDTFGVGKLQCSKFRGENCRPLYSWRCYSRQAEEILRAVYPYLIIKKEQTDLALAFRALVMPVGTNKLEQANTDQRLQIVSGLKGMHGNNRRVG